ncbi:MAG TPA: twin-arginine translocase subunit TatC [Nevskiales bacterium]|nr:twin-arginine translocase subunit TatC [Nevskiales bacterium]
MNEPLPEQPLIAHLLELRNRLLRMIIGVLVVFAPLAFYAGEIFNFVAGPLLDKLPAGSAMIATEVASPFLTPFKLALVLAVILSMPWLLYQTWAFVAPGLYQSERRLILPLLVSSTLLFYLGMAFAYFLVLPMVFGFFVSIAPAHVTVMTDIRHYLDFVLGMFLAFGLAFETPVAIVLLVWAGVVMPSQLTAARGYVLIGCFIVGMLLTPPDVFSQTLLAVPMYLLFELGIIAARVLVPGYKEVEAQRRQMGDSDKSST